jgi:hypothetical protein
MLDWLVAAISDNWSKLGKEEALPDQLGGRKSGLLLVINPWRQGKESILMPEKPIFMGGNYE